MKRPGSDDGGQAGIDLIVRAIVETATRNCCGLRGRYCQFHSGYEEGLWDMYVRLEVDDLPQL